MFKNKKMTRDNFSMNYQSSCGMMDDCMCPPTCMQCEPICECPENRVCHKVVNYEVPHIIPIHTTTVNHHIYNHSYTPVYTYSSVDEVENVYQNRCCK